MELLHEIVVHKRFGQGKIVSFNGHVLEVEFDQYGRRAFAYPTAFETFLAMQNSDLAEEIQADLNIALQAEREKQAQKMAVIEKEREALAAQKPAKKKRTTTAKTVTRTAKKV